ncbi:MAG: ATPase [Acidobacteria bacterium]|nr:MAG: ATPase [Acidobacteriota bacterium]REK10106.1 MAG: ATPase [Acidobacteriota bacterium]
MRKTFFLLFVLLLGAVATPALAADSEGGAISTGLGIAALGLGVAAAGAGLGQGRAAAAAAEGMARNPGASGRIQTALLLALAFMESLVIFTFVIVFQIRGLAG